ncbi:MAG: hypothetical protein GXX86_07695 [Propionibacterium sp.]|nr:hypothetical protein [Propionibacterium sp.]
MRKTKTFLPLLMAAFLPLAAACTADDDGATTEPVDQPTTQATEDTGEPTGEQTGEPTEEQSETPAEESTAEAGGEVLTFDGIGDISLGDTDLVERGAMVLEPECSIYIASPEYSERGIEFQLEHTPEEPKETDPLAEISITEPPGGGEPVTTEAGAHAGMTFGEIKGLYETTEDTKDGDGGPFAVLVAEEGEREMVFVRAENFSTDPIQDSEVVESITVRDPSPQMRGSC